MVKEKRILSYFVGWLIIGFCIIFIGVNKVFAAEYNINYNYSQKYFDNRGSSVVGVNTTWNESLESYISDNITTVAGSYGAGLSITSPIPILENHTYTLSIYFVDRNNIALSSKNYLAFSSTLQGAANNYANGEYDNELITSSVSNNSILNFAFTSRRNGSYIFIPWTTTTNVTQNYVVTKIIMEDLGSEGVSINEINSSLNNQTNTLNNSIQNSTDTITNEIDDMEQSIIDSNKETQNVIKDQFNSCIKEINFSLDKGKYFNQNGSLSENLDYYYTSNYIELKSNSIIISNVENATYSRLITYDENKNLIDWFSFYNRTFTFDSNVKYIRFSTISSNVKLEYTEEICSNKIDETNDKLDNLQGALTDSSAPNTSGLENSAGWLPAGPLDSVLNLPLSLFNALTTNLNKTCNPINIPLPYVNKNITLPCINTLYNQIGITSFLSWIGVIVSGLMLYTYLLKLYKWIEDRISLNETHNVDSWGGL